jgi:PqqD family protein of HPr-rel-A system
VAPDESSSATADSRPHRRTDVVVRPTGDDALLYDPAGDSVHLLNATALAVWQLCDGRHTPEEIAHCLRGLFAGVPDEEAFPAVREALAALQRLGLIQHNGNAMINTQEV